MPDWLHVSEAEYLLHDLVVASYALAFTALVAWLGCFCYRGYHLFHLRRRTQAEASLTEAVLTLLSEASPDGARFLREPRWRRRVLRIVLQGLIAQTRGEDHDRLLQLAHTAGFEEEARRSVVHGNKEERTGACVWLNYFAGPRALALLQTALEDRDLGVRLAAARALLRHDAVPTLRGLLGKLKFSEEDPPLALADLFHHLPDSLKMEAVGMLDSDLPPKWRAMLAVELARNQAKGTFYALRALIRSNDDSLRVAGWLALRELGNPAADGWLPGALAHASPAVRIAACRCAGVVGSAETLPLLRHLLADQDWWVRYHAASALHELGSPGRAVIVEQASRAVDPAGDVGLQVLRERGEGAAHAS
jgi:hypothetical protein